MGFGCWLHFHKAMQHEAQHLVKVIGVALPRADVPYNVSAKVDAKFAAMVKDL